MIKRFCIINGKIVEATDDKARIFLYVSPGNEEKRQLIDHVGIDEHTLHSSLDPHELGRIEFEEDHLAVILKVVKRRLPEGHFLNKPTSLGLFLFSDKLIFVIGEDWSWEEKIFSNVHSLQEVFLKIILECVLRFESHLKAIYDIYEQLESKISHAFSNENLALMFQLEKSLIYYLDALDSNGKVIDLIRVNASKVNFSPDLRDLLEDLSIENNQCRQQATFFAEILSNLMDAWASIINNDLNTRIKTLTILSIGIMVPTLVVSIFSMNVPLPIPQGGTLVSFWAVLGAAVCAMIAILAILFLEKGPREDQRQARR